MIYYKLLGQKVEASTFDPFCTYYCEDAGGDEWAITGERQRWPGYERQRWPGYERQRWIARFKDNSITADSMRACAELVSLQTAPPPARIQVQVTCDTGKTWVTTINGDLAQAKQYFMGVRVTDEEHPYTGEQTVHRVTGVVQL